MIKRLKLHAVKTIQIAGNNWSEREGNYEHGMYRQGRMEKENKILGTGRCKNIDNQYITYFYLLYGTTALEEL